MPSIARVKVVGALGGSTGSETTRTGVFVPRASMAVFVWSLVTQT